MFYLAHAGHEHPAKVSNDGFIIIGLVVAALLLATVAGIYFAKKRQAPEPKDD